MTSQAPSVSVIVPVRNEIRHIEACIRALLEQVDPPERYEVLAVDGISDDGTRELLAEIAREDPRLRVLDNPRKIVSTGLNLAIEEAVGDVIIRVDGHTTVARDFVRANLNLFAEHPEAWSVGGPIAHRGITRTARSIAAAMSSAIGVGGASHRFESYEGYAEGTAFPAFRSWVFDRIGRFDESLVRNQDDELNFRITLAGGKIFISPRVKHQYFVRGSYRALFSQYMQYAYWKIEVTRKHKRIIAVRHLAPGVFIVALPVCLVASVALPPPVSFVPMTPLVAYVGLLGTLAVTSGYRTRDMRVGLGAAAAAATMHVAYGLGTLAGLVSRPSQHGQIARLMSRITR